LAEGHASSVEFIAPGATRLRAGQLSLELHPRPGRIPSACLLPGAPPSSTPKGQASYQKEPFSLALYGD